MIKWGVAIAVLAAVVVALLSWPFVNVVETGRTPEYPDLRGREYAARPAQVADELKRAAESLSGWTVTGSGSGRGGHAMHATHVLFGRIQEDVTARILATPAGSSVSVRSASRFGPWDLGQNARNIEQLLAALDARMRSSN